MRRGDTIVEVMLAMAMLGAVVIGVMGVMNFSHATLEASLDRTRVQALMESQLDLVRYARDQKVLDVASPNPGRDLWDDLVIATDPLNGTVCADNQNATWANPNSKMIIVPNGADFAVSNAVNRRSDYQPQPGEGMWVEIGEGTNDMLEVAVKACWAGLGSRPDQQAKITLTLVDPR